ncbi:hypothetical protein KJS94_06010 [Flavihumibacter rivuli]|uniref:hypothetical protein n=1 Tax=Flavihumibacter rivuli TaxID=2838156 RepID=UPI001BDF3A95|nr:hypothetical protein [Flavihumibacter rivuli]ULQ57751.1 hypothetical protein KJS94_06010 [Flavihumibacter rivuli]
MPNSIINHYHEELEDWHNTIEFYSGEIEGFEASLSDLIHSNTIPHLAENAEYFLNQFSGLRSEFGGIGMELAAQEARLEEKEKMEQDVKYASQVTQQQNTLRDRMKTVEQHFIELKYSCQQFLATHHR